MARQLGPLDDPLVVGDLLARFVNEPDVTEERLLAVLDRLVDAGWGDSRFAVAATFDLAATMAGCTGALGAFEADDIGRLKTRCDALRLLGAPWSPVVRRLDLAAQLDAVTGALDAHREQILRTGRLPWVPVQGRGPNFVEVLLAQLYPTDRVHADGTVVPLLLVPSEDARRLRDLRARLLSAKAEAARMMARALTEPELDLATGLCTALARTLSRDDAAWLDALDSRYAAQRDALVQAPGFPWSPGGLSSLRTLAAFVDALRALAEWDDLANSIANIRAASGAYPVRFRWSDSYFEVVGHETRDRIDGVLENFERLLVQVDARGAAFSRRWQHALGTEFNVEVVARALVPGKHAKLLAEFLQGLSDASAAYVRATGELPKLGLGLGQTKQGNRLAREGRGWRLSVDGVEKWMRPLKGMALIAAIAAQRGTYFSAREVEEMAAGGLTRLKDLGPGEELMSDEALKAVRNRIVELSEWIEDSDPGEADEWRDELAQLQRRMRSDTREVKGPGGKRKRVSRRATTADDQARWNVTHRIDLALKALRAEHPAAFKHFDVFLEYGATCRYKAPQEAAILVEGVP